MSDIGETFGALREERQAKRASNRESSPQLLTAAGIAFETKNDGAHLIVYAASCVADFWPGTGLWIVRYGNRGRGVRRLISHLQGLARKAKPVSTKDSK